MLSCYLLYVCDFQSVFAVLNLAQTTCQRVLACHCSCDSNQLQLLTEVAGVFLHGSLSCFSPWRATCMPRIYRQGDLHTVICLSPDQGLLIEVYSYWQICQVVDRYRSGCHCVSDSYLRYRPFGCIVFSVQFNVDRKIVILPKQAVMVQLWCSISILSY